MADGVALDGSLAIRPAGSITIVVIVTSVQAEAGDLTEDVAAASINRDPLAVAAVAKLPKGTRHGRLVEFARGMQNVRHGAGAIVGAVLEVLVTSATAVGLRADAVSG